MFGNVYHNRRVLITGHTGFKGSWLTLWLSQLGADITGYALPPSSDPNHFDLLQMDMASVPGDVRDAREIERVFQACRPEIVFHLAAQPIVRLSYQQPVDTIATNVMGTANVLEAARKCETVRAVVNVTSDKCYQNREGVWGYRETDRLGGKDPYSVSKGCAELITDCWRDSFFKCPGFDNGPQTLLASCRAGNVIGGGDWGCDRLLPDLMRAAQKGEPARIRNPKATRPWQHVLDALAGYLLLGQRLLEGRAEFAEAWNFGPRDLSETTVADLAEQAQEIWPRVRYALVEKANQPYEAQMLRLDCSKSHLKLLWQPVWQGKTAIAKTVSWYRTYYGTKVVQSLQDLRDYVAEAGLRDALWCRE